MSECNSIYLNNIIHDQELLEEELISITSIISCTTERLAYVTSEQPEERIDVKELALLEEMRSLRADISRILFTNFGVIDE